MSILTAAEAGGDPSSAGQTGFAPPSRRRRGASPHFTVTAQGRTVGFLVLREQDRTEHVATEKELAEAEKNSWIRIPRYDRTPSERLRLVLSGGQPHRASAWADTPGRPLEDQLAEITQEVTLRGQAAERGRLDEIEAARQKRIRGEAAVEEARIRYAETYRVRHFEAQEAARRHATRSTEYMSTVRTRVEAMPPGQAGTDAEAWISWAAATVERLDPLSTPPRLPGVPEPRATASDHSSGTGAPTAPPPERLLRQTSGPPKYGGSAPAAAVSGAEARPEPLRVPAKPALGSTPPTQHDPHDQPGDTPSERASNGRHAQGPRPGRSLLGNP
jgi:hypothetical protein